MANSTTTSTTAKPEKPYPEFPLTPHPRGMWVKKVKGTLHTFGKWGHVVGGKLVRIDDPADADAWWKPALAEYQRTIDDIQAGRKPRPADDDAVTVETVVDAFLSAKKRQREAGEMTAKMWREYKEACDMIVGAWGVGRRVDDLRPDDFASLRSTLARKWGVVRLGNVITRIRSVMKYATANRIIDREPYYGTEFNKPGKATMRKHRAKSGPKMFTPEECRELIDGKLVDGEAVKPTPTMRAMILLGLNAGLGNHDVAALKHHHIGVTFADRTHTTLTVATDKNGVAWLDYPRPKTGIPRRCPLWAETVEAINAVLAENRKPASHEAAGLVMLTTRGTPYIRDTETARVDLVAIQFGELVKALGIHKKGVGFYGLRHAHQTVAENATRDFVAVSSIMGHATDNTMAGQYREHISDERLRAVVNAVREWLWPTTTNEATTNETAAK